MSTKVKLTNVRLSFPSLFNKSVFEGKEGKFEGTFLIEKDDQAKLIKKVNDAMDQFLINKFGDKKKIPKALKRTCFKDGDESDYDGYENHMALKAGSTGRPTVINRDKSPVVESDDVFYAGCYVNAIIDFWYSDHPKGGKQLLANLMGVQFAKDGESFSGIVVADVDDFDDIDDDDDEDEF